MKGGQVGKLRKPKFRIGDRVCSNWVDRKFTICGIKRTYGRDWGYWYAIDKMLNLWNPERKIYK